jgi:hypothetical protein
MAEEPRQPEPETEAPDYVNDVPEGYDGDRCQYRFRVGGRYRDRPCGLPAGPGRWRWAAGGSNGGPAPPRRPNGRRSWSSALRGGRSAGPRQERLRRWGM